MMMMMINDEVQNEMEYETFSVKLPVYHSIYPTSEDDHGELLQPKLPLRD